MINPKKIKITYCKFYIRKMASGSQSSFKRWQSQLLGRESWQHRSTLSSPRGRHCACLVPTLGPLVDEINQWPLVGEFQNGWKPGGKTWKTSEWNWMLPSSFGWKRYENMEHHWKSIKWSNPMRWKKQLANSETARPKGAQGLKLIDKMVWGLGLDWIVVIRF